MNSHSITINITYPLYIKLISVIYPFPLYIHSYIHKITMKSQWSRYEPREHTFPSPQNSAPSPVRPARRLGRAHFEELGPSAGAFLPGDGMSKRSQCGEKTHLEVSWNGGYPQIIHSNRIFPYKPSIFGYLHFRNPPFGNMITMMTMIMVVNMITIGYMIAIW